MISSAITVCDCLLDPVKVIGDPAVETWRSLVSTQISSSYNSSLVPASIVLTHQRPPRIPLCEIEKLIKSGTLSVTITGNTELVYGCDILLIQERVRGWGKL